MCFKHTHGKDTDLCVFISPFFWLLKLSVLSFYMGNNDGLFKSCLTDCNCSSLIQQGGGGLFPIQNKSNYIYNSAT